MLKTNAIIYHPNLAPRFADYGIPVPLNLDRSTLVWHELTKVYDDLSITGLDELPILSWQDVSLVHDLDFVARLLDDQLVVNEIAHCYEFSTYQLTPGEKQLKEMPSDVLTQCRGTHAAALKALEHNCSFFLGGGMHHAMSFGGRGFCLLNDVIISAKKLQRDHLIKKALIIDVDVHKGDGSAQMTYHDDTIATLSVHMKDGWPLDESLGPGPWDLPSTLDIVLDIGHEASYVTELERALLTFDLTSFDFAFIVLGADVWEFDELPSSSAIKLNLTQMLERDLLIENTLTNVGLAHTYVMGGGYGAIAHVPYVQFIKKLLD